MKIRINGKPVDVEKLTGKVRCKCEADESRITHTKTLLAIAKEISDQDGE